MGRKNKYETNVKPHLKDIPKWYETMTEAQIAGRLGVSVASFENYKLRYPELVKCLKSSKEALVEELKATLKMKAKGFNYTETKTILRKDNGKDVKIIEKYEKYAQPDTGAIHLLLKNLDDNWRQDDKCTLDLKREKMELEKQKAENESW